MQQNQITVFYAKAIFITLQNESFRDNILQELQQVIEIIQFNPLLEETLNAPIVDFEAKQKLIRTLKLKISFSDITQNIMLILIKNKRFKLLTEIVTCLSELIKESQGSMEATIISARELPDSEFMLLQNLLKEKYNTSFIYTRLVDKSLIGGVIIKFDNKILDASIIGALNKFKNKSNEIISVL